MENTFKLKIGVIFSLLFFLTQNILAGDFILNHDDLIDKRAYEKINQIGSEVKSKLNVNVYLNVKENLSLGKDLPLKEKFTKIKSYEKEIISKLKKPYILLNMSIDDIYVNILYSKDLEKLIDKDEILDGYVVPLLASKDKNSLFAKVSAAVLNGYAAIADTLAQKRNIKLETSIGNQGKISSTIWRVLMYTLIVLGLFLYTYAVLKRKK